MTNAVVLPLYFISGVFVPFRQLPDGLQSIAELLPAQPFVDALRIAFDPNTGGAGVAGDDLLKLAFWGVIGLVLAARTFDWTPRHLTA
jgi:ABC-2 type transport system permease protein